MDEITKVLGGYIHQEFKCVHNHFSGTLYCGPEAMLFLGRIVFLEWKLVIRWRDVVQMNKNKNINKYSSGKGDGGDDGDDDNTNNNSNNNVIHVLVKDGTIYEFEQLLDPPSINNIDLVYNTLFKLHIDAAVLDKPRLIPTPREEYNSLRRINSDPPPSHPPSSSQVFHFDNNHDDENCSNNTPLSSSPSSSNS